MASLIEGWFQLTNGRSFGDTTSPSPKSKSYLSLYNSCANLGLLSKKVFINCELRLFSPGNQDLEGRVIHAHGRFLVVTPIDGDEPHLEIEVDRFVIMDAMDPASNNIPDDLRTSITLLGRVVPLTDVDDTTADKFFMLEVRDYVRDRNQTFNIQFVGFPLLLKHSLTHV